MLDRVSGTRSPQARFQLFFAACWPPVLQLISGRVAAFTPSSRGAGRSTKRQAALYGASSSSRVNDGRTLELIRLEFNL